jgi:small-conductance mechanosensitive channel
MITKSVIHHTYSDPKVSAVVSLVVPYGTDAERACTLLAEVGKRHPRVLRDPPSIARVTSLGDNGIGMELSVWINDPALGESDLKSELMKDILRTFREHRIEIAAPRREIRTIPTSATGDSVEVSRG